MEGRFIETKGLRLWHVEAGSGTPVVYVHGNTGSSLWFERVMDIPGARTLALDLPNFGRSDPHGDPISIDMYGDAIGAFIDALGLERPVVVGHSLGGGAAMSLAARRPALLGGLVLVDSASPSGLATPESFHPFIETMRTNRAVLAQALAGVVPTLKDDACLARLVDEALLMAKPAWVGNAVALGAFNYVGRCAAFKAPVLVLWGRKDGLVSEAMARETAAAFPSARLELLEDCGHSVIVEDPGRFRSLLGAFLSSLA